MFFLPPRIRLTINISNKYHRIPRSAVSRVYASLAANAANRLLRMPKTA